jgi:DNA mismatch endonuclease (patch repair protein)
MDVFSKKKRSAVMARIRSKGNLETEVSLIRLFRKHRVTGWRRNQHISGHPDFIFKEMRIAVFVDGCFWHGCPKHGTMPRSNRIYWKRKLERNFRRDRTVSRELRRDGWTVLRIWQHELAKKNEGNLVRRLARALPNKKRQWHRSRT